ncbi:MAG: helix-turn-helix domain containing protein [Candidatus Pacebacteria bacterium]|nr:helix-turn-helix domain containing protein [Candidatus Paceibacterota bacterium]
MARRLDKEKAIKLRLQGKSYSQIKAELNVSKSTLSGWLSCYPLSREKINELRAHSAKRIERYRNAMQRKRELAFEDEFTNVSKEIGTLTPRDLLIGGIFLYWGEGSKSSNYLTSVSNTDPNVLRFFIKWLGLFGIDKKDLRVKLHLYKDMDASKEVAFWSKELKLPCSCFQRLYIKDSNLSGLTYKNGFGHGTCNIRYFRKHMWQYWRAALRYIREESVV